MITRSSGAQERAIWQRELREAYRDPRDLLEDLGLNADEFDLPACVTRNFPFRVTRAYASRIRHADADDPLLLQVLPTATENETTAGYSDDPVGEFGLGAGSNLIQKYSGRALLVMTGACAINCRYCFRRAYPYAGNTGTTALTAGLAAIMADPTINEVILSGGDPLLLDDPLIADVMGRLSAIPHVRRVRVHTRMPVVLPARMTASLQALLTRQRFPVVVVIHVNHPREIDPPTRTILQRCHDAGIVLLNQSVLLARVNDDAETLVALAEQLFEARVLPYYVHLLDRVSGTAHFEVPASRALALEAQLRASLPGYLMPRFVRELAGASSKLPLQSVIDSSLDAL